MRKSALTVVVCLLLVIRIFPQQQDLSDNENRAFEVLKTSLSFSATIKDKVWPGFDLNNYAFVLTSPQSGAYLIGFNKAPEGTTRVTTNAFNTPVYFTRDNRVYAGNTSQVVAGKHTAIIQINSLAGSLSKGIESAMGLVFHESFHAFEGDKSRPGIKWLAENIMILPDYPDDSVKSNSLFRIESQILFKALQSSDKSDLNSLLQQFITVRTERQKALEPSFVQFEKHLELNEGLADYAETKSTLLAIEMVSRKEITLPLKYSQAGDFLSTRFAPLNSINKIGSNVRERFYYTGASQALLLDRLKSDWKKRVQYEGASLQDLLAEPTDSASQNVQAILKQYDFDGIAKDEEQIISKRKARRQALADSVEGQRNYTIDVSALGHMGNYKSFDPWNEVPVSRTKRVHTSVLSIEQEGVYKAYFSQAVVEDLGKLRYVTALGPVDQQKIIVDGVTVSSSEPMSKRFETSLKIKTPNFDLEAPSGIISINEHGITIRIGKNLPIGPDAGAKTASATVGDSVSSANMLINRFLNLELSDIDGTKHKLSEMKGQQFYVLFITAQSWAKPAHSFFDALNSAANQQQLLSNNTRFIVIASQSSYEQLREFLKAHRTAFPVFLDDANVAATMLSPVPGDLKYPFMVGISPEGKKNYSQSGFTPANVEEARKRLFATK